MANLFHTFADRIARPEAAFLMQDGAVTRQGELAALSARYGRALEALGVGAGDRVAVQTGKHAACLWVYLACLRLGAVYLPLNPAYAPAETAYFVTDAEPRVFVAEAAPDAASGAGPLAEALAAVGSKVVTLDGAGGGSLERAAEAAPADLPTRDVPDDALAAILYTSGTTGRSKGAMISHANLRSNALALAEIWGFGPDDVLLHALPIFHTHGLFVAVNTVLVSGGALLWMPRFDAAAALELMPRATAMMGVPTFYHRLLEHPGLTRAAVAHMRLFVSGSAPLSAEKHRAFAERTGHAILERYGMTETNMITSNPLAGERRAGTVGFPLPGVELRVADPATGAALPAGEVGGVELRGPNVFQGYWRMPEKTAAEFRPDGFFITGDLGYLDPDGYLVISGRAKDLVISGGLNVYPAEVEGVLDSLPGVAESAVIGVPHPDLGEAVVAVVAPVAGAAPDPEALLAAMADRLARYKQPRRIVLVAALPRNAMGKIEKARLRAEHAGLFAP